MKNRIFSFKLFVASLCIMSLAFSGCIKEDLDDCYYLRVKILNADGDELTGSVGASLFIYDENGDYLETKDFKAQELSGYPAIRLDYPADKKLQIVSWSNELGNALVLTRGTKIEDLSMKVKSQSGQAEVPNQAYWGDLTVLATDNGGITHNDTIVLRPQIGQIYIYTLGFQYALQKRVGLRASDIELDSDYKVDNTRDSYDYKAERTGDEIYYKPGIEWKSGELVAPPSNLAAYDSVEVGLNVEQEELVRSSVDDLGNPFIPTPGRQTLVVFQFGESGALISVRQEIRPWGTVDDDIIL